MPLSALARAPRWDSPFSDRQERGAPPCPQALQLAMGVKGGQGGGGGGRAGRRQKGGWRLWVSTPHSLRGGRKAGGRRGTIPRVASAVLRCGQVEQKKGAFVSRVKTNAGIMPPVRENTVKNVYFLSNSKNNKKDYVARW